MPSSPSSTSSSTPFSTNPVSYPPFQPVPSPSLLSAPWCPHLSIPTAFPPSSFTHVMTNLLRNPNITSSHLFRADIYYDSLTDGTASWPVEAAATGTELSERVRWMQETYWPRLLGGVGGVEALGKAWKWERTWVRGLVPRKPEVDRKLVQSCHLFRCFERGKEEEGGGARGGKEGEKTVMIYVPHVETVDEMPFYHPAVRAIAFLHEWHAGSQQRVSGFGTLSIHIVPFSKTELHSNRLDRTVRNLLQVLHKHGHGHVQGYTKRVHHDQIIGQKRFQDEYTRLKSKYARTLCEGWAEVTDLRKHVFEDLGIAAFLTCLWDDIGKGKGNFPGFVDIGCGNGVLVNVLIREGWEGWGFDARRRKSWDGFPEEVTKRLEERVLVPRILQQARFEKNNAAPTKIEDGNDPCVQLPFHDGVFLEGTFIISNHADELTGWTPLLARLSRSPFIAIPCCSHDLAGARFRAPASGLRSQTKEPSIQTQIEDRCDQPKNGSLGKPKDANKQPSAYASLCSYITNLTENMGYFAEKEMLRIPSTRNEAIIGREISKCLDEDVENKIARLLEGELRKSVRQTADDWIVQANRIIQSKGSH
ncbi:DUF1613-domain-containing protein [Viridothelium virens]|uniref:tRNA (uracil-O(2)-)-methyltransferase n=1 Tax=Viridothelium virens TaxID=1048519 RepID=A0A6A6HID8_VIRVR|nr:DUF1613-domain-containing protein [Viridothelium virens]